MHKRLNTLVLAVFTTILTVWPAPGLAQQVPGEPQIILTWRADTYVPPEYAGKGLPSPGAPVNAAVELLVNDKLADLSKQTIYWYLNGDFLRGGPGVQEVKFLAGQFPDPVDVRVELPDYNGQLLLKTVTVPVVTPEVVIEAPFPDGKFDRTPLQVRAKLYFLNQSPSSVFFNWSVNGQEPVNAENPDVLTVNVPTDTPGGYALNINLAVQNIQNILLDGVFHSINLTYAP